MRYDVTFTNGVVKSRERFLLCDKIDRMAESSLDDAFRMLKESGFGGDIAVDSPHRAESLVRAEEAEVNDFIRKYAPTDKIAAFLLAEYDFHNAEALVKCRYAGADEQKLLSAEGFYRSDIIKDKINGGASELPAELIEAILQSAALFESGKANGLEIDCIFKRLLFLYLKRLASDKKLKEIASASADAANVSSALRSRDARLTEKMFVEGGKLPKSLIIALSEASYQEIKEGEFSPQIKEAAAACERGEPLTLFEKSRDDFPLSLLYKTRYDMIGCEPFLTYVLKRRAEIANVRIIFVSKAAGFSPSAVKSRIRLY
ncbi:MAG: V-type ATPase subunit [Clostridia bacterium]|nr:V-type ATPase subunit [Clostridia bacterium]